MQTLFLPLPFTLNRGPQIRGPQALSYVLLCLTMFPPSWNTKQRPKKYKNVGRMKKKILYYDCDQRLLYTNFSLFETSSSNSRSKSSNCSNDPIGSGTRSASKTSSSTFWTNNFSWLAIIVSSFFNTAARNSAMWGGNTKINQHQNMSAIN